MKKKTSPLDPWADAAEGGVQADYYTLHYLKQPEELAPWVVVTEHWPTREEAETKAEALREGRHASITIKPQRW